MTSEEKTIELMAHEIRIGDRVLFEDGESVEITDTMQKGTFIMCRWENVWCQFSNGERVKVIR